MNYRWVWRFVLFVPVLIEISCTKQETEDETSMILGHAGTSIYPERCPYPPNTFESCRYALDILCAQGIEVDVQLTADKKLILFHDYYLNENSDLTGCIGNFTLFKLELEKVYHTAYKFVTLERIVNLCSSRQKYLMLDIKHYNFCNSSLLTPNELNTALAESLTALNETEKKQVIVNTQYEVLLDSLSDLALVKCFETQSPAEGIQFVKDGRADMLCLPLEYMDAAYAEQMKKDSIPFMLFNVKTPADHKQAIQFNPTFIISDNISFAKKITR
ncbi:MAG: hypothetical protein IPM74_02200 [Crocinitomicaceae bacterium]|nr:hypothetical protein [Crocinitomicaceae bacterium]